MTTMIINLLPDKKYEKYLRLFTGMVFILLVFRPFTDISGLEERLAGSFEKITFRNDAKLLTRELEDMDKERLERLLSGYRDTIELDIRNMAEGNLLEVREICVEFEDGGGDEPFGIAGIRAVVGIPEEINGPEKDERFLGTGREIEKLKKKIGEYYGLEEGKITIDLEDK
jgi:stage III sporulation protein AF